MITKRHSTSKIFPASCDDYFIENGQNVSYKPLFGGFQLIGDSLLVRFTNQILYNHHTFPFGARTIDYCINGQRIDQLRQRIKLRTFPLSSKVMVLIGTNDVLCGGNIQTMTKHFNSLLNLLKKSADKVLILTLPPIPKLSVTFYHWTLIRQYNAYLKSLDDGRGVVVADICPLFTKFTPALEYEITVVRDPRFESGRQGKKRKSCPNHRRTKALENRKSLPNAMRSDESDYRNSTDTNTSVDSEALSSEDRENFQNTVPEEQPTKSCQKRSSENIRNQGRFVVRTLESVFGKQVLNRKKTEEQLPLSAVEAEQPEKKPRKSPMDLNDNIYATDNWLVESDEDSMSEHVYKSQEDTDYDIIDVSINRKSVGTGEFSRFMESMNADVDTPKRSACQRRLKRSSLKNEKPEDTESSSSSGVESPKRQICPFIDPNFRHFFEKRSNSADDSFISNSSLNSSFSAIISSPEAGSYKSGNYWRRFSDPRGSKIMNGLSGRDKLLMHLARKICHLEFYELFYSSRKKRMDMIHLNYKGLTEIKNFLIANNYVNM